MHSHIHQAPMVAACHGLLVIDKPGGITSRAAVDRAARWFPHGTRLGHTGTLDPLATGVLVLCVGKATRLGEYVQRMAKTYEAGLRLGATSDSDDADGTITPMTIEPPPSREVVLEHLREFVGAIDQVPPAFSAAKVTGRRAYALSRRGQQVDLAPRRVHVQGIDVVDYAYPRLDIVVRCGKGTYIRSLARDLGARLGCGALVESLRRIRVGIFDEAQALSLDDDAATAQARLLPLATAVADLPRVNLDKEQVARLCHGQALPVPALDFADTTDVGVFDEADTFIGVGIWDLVERVLKPAKMLAERG